MRKNILVFLILMGLLVFIVLVSAVDFTPQGDINLRNIYDIINWNISDCGAGELVKGILSNGTWNCTAGGTGDITGVNTIGPYLYGGCSTGECNLYQNETYLNATIDDRATGGNSSWNETYADTKYADISMITDNASWNESHADTLYIQQSDETNLDVNSSEYWDDLNSINTTQMEDNFGILNILESWLTTFWNNLWGAKTTDDLTEGTTNLYDNQSWNESHTNDLYYLISNPSNFWNDTYATFNKTYADTLYSNNTDTNCSGDQDCVNILYESDLPLANKTTPHCSNITGATSDLCTITPGAGSGKSGDPPYLYNDSTVMYFNETYLNGTIDDRATGLGDNASWNQTLTDSLYLLLNGSNANQNIDIGNYDFDARSFNASSEITSPIYFFPNRYNSIQSEYIATTDVIHYAEGEIILRPGVGAGTYNFSSTGLDLNGGSLTNASNIITQGDEANLDVNSSEYWDDMNSINTTQFEDDGGLLHLLDSWLTSFLNAWFGTKDTDDLAEGSTNLYDNQSWNESLADGLYADISVTGDNSSWNESHADTLYADISVVDTDTNASTACSGEDTYLDGEGNCDDIGNKYVNASGDTVTGNMVFQKNATWGDDDYLCFGDSGCDDSYMYFNGTALIFKVN